MFNPEWLFVPTDLDLLAKFERRKHLIMCKAQSETAWKVIQTFGRLCDERIMHVFGDKDKEDREVISSWLQFLP